MNQDIKGNIKLNSDVRLEDRRIIIQKLKTRYPQSIINESIIINLTYEAERRVKTLFEQGWILHTNLPSPLLTPPKGDEREMYGSYYISVPFNNFLVNVPHYALLKNAGKINKKDIQNQRNSSVRNSCVLH